MKQGSVRLDEKDWARVLEHQKRMADKGPKNISMNDALIEIIDRGLRESERKR
jgi:hypothetical protein